MEDHPKVEEKEVWNIEYQQESSHPRLVISTEGPLDTEGYSIRMITEGSIGFLLPCHVQKVNQSTRLCYDVTSKQPLSRMFEKRKYTYEDLFWIYRELVAVWKEMKTYLLNPEQLLLREEYLFSDAARTSLFFCCIPGSSGSFSESLQKLSEDLLPKIDHGDGAAVTFGYACFRQAMEKEFQIREWEALLYLPGDPAEKKEKESEKVQIRESPLWEESFVMQEEFHQKEKWRRREEEEKGDKKGEKRLLWWGIVVFGLFTIIFLLIILRMQGILPDFSAEQMTGLILVLLGAGVGAGFWTERQGQKEDTEELPELQAGNTRQEKSVEPVYEEYDDKTEFSGFIAYEEPEEREVTQPLIQEEEKACARLVPKSEANTNKNLSPIFLSREVTVIGKLSSACDAVIPAQTISRMHARIQKREDQYYLEDLNSRNGTFRNGQLLNRQEAVLLEPQDQIAFADCVYLFCDDCN